MINYCKQTTTDEYSHSYLQPQYPIILIKPLWHTHLRVHSACEWIFANGSSTANCSLFHCAQTSMSAWLLWMESLCVTIIATIMWGAITALADWDTSSIPTKGTALVRCWPESTRTTAFSSFGYWPQSLRKYINTGSYQKWHLCRCN